MTNEPLIDPEPEEEDGWEEIVPEQGTIEDTEDTVTADTGEQIATQLEVCEALKEAYKNDKNLQMKLLFYLTKIIYGKTESKTINGRDAEEFLSFAIEKIISGVRKWNPIKIPNIVHLIILAAVSEIRHEEERLQKLQRKYSNDTLISEDLLPEEGKDDIKKRNRITPKIIPLYHTDNEGKEIENSIADEYDARQNMKEYKEMYDEEKDFEELCSPLESALEEDEIAFFVLQERINGEKSNKKIAANLGITVRDVENALKKIKRLSKKLKIEGGHE